MGFSKYRYSPEKNAAAIFAMNTVVFCCKDFMGHLVFIFHKNHHMALFDSHFNGFTPEKGEN